MTDPSGGMPTVLVAVGTDKHPFDRLVRWIDQWLETRDGSPVSCFIQYGTSLPPRAAEGARYLEHDALEDRMRRCALVVTHGGPTTISEARQWGHRPLVVPRQARLGEHVDDHQVRFTNRLSSAGLIHVVGSCAELMEALESGLHAAPHQQVTRSPAPHSAAAFAAVVDAVLRDSGTGRGARRRGRAASTEGSREQ